MISYTINTKNNCRFDGQHRTRNRTFVCPVKKCKLDFYRVIGGKYIITKLPKDSSCKSVFPPFYSHTYHFFI